MASQTLTGFSRGRGTALPIAARETTAKLHDRLSVLGASLIVTALDRIDALKPTPQPEAGVTYAHKIDKAEARIDWTRPAVELDRVIRGLAPFPGAWTLQDSVRIKLLMARPDVGEGQPGEVLDDALRVACGTGALTLERLQRAGSSVQDADVFQRGSPISKGTLLGE